MVGGGTERRRRGWRRRGDGRAARGVEVAGRQRRGGSARRLALGKGCLCRVSDIWHSAKELALRIVELSGSGPRPVRERALRNAAGECREVVAGPRSQRVQELRRHCLLAADTLRRAAPPPVEAAVPGEDVAGGEVDAAREGGGEVGGGGGLAGAARALAGSRHPRARRGAPRCRRYPRAPPGAAALPSPPARSPMRCCSQREGRGRRRPLGNRGRPAPPGPVVILQTPDASSPSEVGGRRGRASPGSRLGGGGAAPPRDPRIRSRRGWGWTQRAALARVRRGARCLGGRCHRQGGRLGGRASSAPPGAPLGTAGRRELRRPHRAGGGGGRAGGVAATGCWA
ncbi:hypothetical protein PVAP13_8NG115601 [Panicum virgatum]|uniref:Uncharacterized protein n=1 Tax=Panicum virgatum TaxID=38727 RepID=A0A8T0PBK3_PANVG|nr:hypothetical protein PVAP13_8NG115601 [Panicum virgatum]